MKKFLLSIVIFFAISSIALADERSCTILFCNNQRASAVVYVIAEDQSIIAKGVYNFDDCHLLTKSGVPLRLKKGRYIIKVEYSEYEIEDEELVLVVTEEMISKCRQIYEGEGECILIE